MRCSKFLIAAAASAASFGTSEAVAAREALNPIRKVVNLLQAMQKKVEVEGEKEKELYDRFICYCKNGDSDLTSSIEAATEKGPQVTSAIEASEGKLAQTKEDLATATTDRDAAKKAIAEAKAIRAKEAAEFAAETAEAKTNVAAMEKAIAAIEHGMGGAFLQTPGSQVLRQFVQHSQDLLVDSERQELVAFLSADAAYAPQSGQITGILKQMHETMAGDLADATKKEEEAIADFEALMEAKTKEVEALAQGIEQKQRVIGELGVEIVQMKEDLDDSQAALLADKKFLVQLKKNCATKTAEWEERSKTRAEELVALADTVKVLNDDDALDLFKKTLPSPAKNSFLQVAASAKSVRARAVEVLRQAQKGGKHRAGLDFLMLALTGKKSLSAGGFDKVISMCDEMVSVLKQEQVDDDNKKEYCGTQFDLADDKKKALERTISDHENAIATAEESIKTLTEEIAALEAGIKALDKSVAEATEQRKEENAEFKELVASDTAAKQVLEFAKNRLNKFYNKALYKAPPKRELSAEGRIEASVSGTEPPTEAPGGIAGTGITALVQLSSDSQDAPPPPPETFGAYSKKSEESTGVIGMIDLLIKDLDKELTEAKAEEKEAQADYEDMMTESAEKRAADSKALAEKESTKADVEAERQKRKEGHSASTKEHAATMKYISSLHGECDWLLQYFDTRKEARTGEIDSIVKAKAVLSGADYSLAQVAAHRHLLRGSK